MQTKEEYTPINPLCELLETHQQSFESREERDIPYDEIFFFEDVLAWRDRLQRKWGWDCILSLAGDFDQSRYWFPFTSARAFRLEGSISNTARFASCIPPPDQPSPNQHFFCGVSGGVTRPLLLAHPAKKHPTQQQAHDATPKQKKCHDGTEKMCAVAVRPKPTPLCM